VTGIELIVAERKRQIEEEGWSVEHDDQWRHSQLSSAAACYAMTKLQRVLPAAKKGAWMQTLFSVIWPFSGDWWKPTPDDRIRELVKSGALVAAEIDRLLRLKQELKS
jgi:hypothetical protein